MVGGARTAEGDWQLDLQNGRRPVSLPAHNTHKHTHARTHTRIHALTHTHTHTYTRTQTHSPSLWLPLSLSWGIPQQFPSSCSPSGRRPWLLPIPSRKLAVEPGAESSTLRGQGQGRLSPTQSTPPPPLRRLPFVSFYTTVNRGRASGVLSEPRSRPLTL